MEALASLLVISLMGSVILPLFFMGLRAQASFTARISRSNDVRRETLFLLFSGK